RPRPALGGRCARPYCRASDRGTGGRHADSGTARCRALVLRRRRRPQTAGNPDRRERRVHRGPLRGWQHRTLSAQRLAGSAAAAAGRGRQQRLPLQRSVPTRHRLGRKESGRFPGRLTVRRLTHPVRNNSRKLLAMKLYMTPGACSLAPHIALNEAKLPFEAVRVDLAAKKLEDGSDFLAVNPKGQVPALALDSGDILTEAAVVLQYIADQAP